MMIRGSGGLGGRALLKIKGLSPGVSASLRITRVWLSKSTGSMTSGQRCEETWDRQGANPSRVRRREVKRAPVPEVPILN